MKNIKRLLAVLLAVCLVFSAAACGADEEEPKAETQKPSETAGNVAAEEDATYTYRSTTSQVSTWNPTDWLFSSENDLIAYTTSPLYAFNMNEDKTGYVIEPEVATAAPEDVTAEYAGNEVYGVPADATEGYAYRVSIREDFTWSDGTPITADDFVYTVSQFLNPEMQNYRASNFYNGAGALANANEYFKGGKVDVVDADGNYAEVEDAELYWSLLGANYLMGGSIDADYADYGSYYVREDGTDIYTDLSALSTTLYNPLTEEAKALLQEIAAYVYGEEGGDAYKMLCFMDGETVSFEEVGIIKNDDHTITFVYANPVSLFNFYYNHGSMYLLNEEKYEANKTNSGSLVKSSYNTSAETAASCGPYIITSYQEDKEVKLEKNENWYGYSDGKHEGQYQTTNIDLQVIDEHATQLNLFLQGNLDTVTLSEEDMESYGTSDYVYYLPQSYTYNYTINSDFNALKAEEVPGENRTILSYIDFRHAISLCMDRSDYVASCTASSVPAFGLLNDIYMSDPENAGVYRDSEAAQNVLKEVYGVDDVADLTGYDKEKAAELFVAAYNQCLADGNITETDQIVMDYHTFGSDASDVKIVDYLQQSIDAAVAGTVLEGRVTVNLVEDPDLYSNQANGLVDIAETAWGGSDLDPFSLMECYLDPGYKGEYGYDPMTDTATINVNGEEITMTTNAWLNEMLYGTYATADVDTRITILAGLEKAVLTHYDAIPLYALTSGILYSQRVVLGSPEFINSVINFGGIQYMTYTMNDAEWAAYCAENNNQLTY